MSSAVEIEVKTASPLMNLDNTSGTGTAPDGGGDAPPDTDPGPIKG